MNLLQQKLEGLTRALDLRTHRHQVLASNIANADTPGYKARDFDFKDAYRNALAGSTGGGLSLATTARGHIAGSGVPGQPELQYRTDVQSAVDGNTVDMDVERSQISENAIQYEILTRFISDRLQGMRSAISGQG